jgi:hypothetical protein
VVAAQKWQNFAAVTVRYIPKFAGRWQDGNDGIFETGKCDNELVFFSKNRRLQSASPQPSIEIAVCKRLHLSFRLKSPSASGLT